VSGNFSQHIFSKNGGERNQRRFVDAWSIFPRQSLLYWFVMGQVAILGAASTGIAQEHPVTKKENRQWPDDKLNSMS
jgi:hypothetical protein